MLLLRSTNYMSVLKCPFLYDSVGSESFSGREVACGERARGRRARRSPGERNDPRKRRPPSLSNSSPGSLSLPSLRCLLQIHFLLFFSIRLPHLRSCFLTFLLFLCWKSSRLPQRAALFATCEQPAPFLSSLSHSRLEQQCRRRRRR